MQVVGKQFAEAPESSAAWTAPVVLTGANATLSVGLRAECTCIALPVFKIIFFVVAVVDGNDTEDPAAVTAGGCDVDCFCSEWFKAKPGLGARLQNPCNCFISRLKRSFLMSFKRASVAPLLVATSLNFGLEACSVVGLTPSRTSLQLLQLGGCGECCFARGSYQ